MKLRISDETSISIPLLIPIIGAIAWITTMYATELQHGQKIATIENKMEKKADADEDFKREVLERLIRIEENQKAYGEKPSRRSH